MEREFRNMATGQTRMPVQVAALAPSFRPEPRNPQQGPGLTEERQAQIYARVKHIGRTEFCRDAVRLPVVGVVERAAVPVVGSSGLQPLKNGQAAQRALSEYRIRVLVIADQPPSGITRLLQPDDPAAKHAAAIEDLDGHPCAVDEPRPVGGGGNSGAGRSERR
jgi:hypothetical protein